MKTDSMENILKILFFKFDLLLNLVIQTFEVFINDQIKKLSFK